MRDDKSAKTDYCLQPQTTVMASQVTVSPGSQIVTVNQAGQVISIMPVHQQPQPMVFANPSPQAFVQYMPMPTAFPGEQPGGQVQYQVIQAPNGAQILQSAIPTQVNPLMFHQQQLQLMHQQQQTIQQQQYDDNKPQDAHPNNNQVLPQQVVQCTQIIRQPPQVIVNPITGQVIGHVAPQPQFAFNPGNQMISHVIQNPQVLTNGSANVLYQTPVQHVSPQVNYSAVPVTPQVTVAQNDQQVFQTNQLHRSQITETKFMTKEAIRIQEIMKQEAEKIEQQKRSRSSALENKQHGNKISSRLKDDPETGNPILPMVSSTTPTSKLNTVQLHQSTVDDNLPSSPDQEQFSDGDHASTNSSSLEREAVTTLHSFDEDNSQSRTSFSSSPSSRMEPESTTQHDTVASAINTNVQVADGVNLAEVMKFARTFKSRRLQLGLTQTQVGASLTQSQGPSYSQSAICR